MGRVPQASCTTATPEATPGALGWAPGPKLSKSHTWIEGCAPDGLEVGQRTDKTGTEPCTWRDPIAQIGF